MEALMTHLLNSARMKQEEGAMPLDLTFRSYTKHTCDSLVTSEDMRSEPDSWEEQVDKHSVFNVQWSVRHSTPVQPATEGGNTETQPELAASTTVTSQTRLDCKPATHPFSIAALIGNNSNSENLNSEAEVFSPFMNNLTYPKFSRDSDRSVKQEISGSNEDLPDTMGHEQSDVSVHELSPIRAVSMLRTRDVFWCHVCHVFCRDQCEAERHQLVHRLHGSPCALRRHVLHEHGYVTRHEQLDTERLHCAICRKVVAACFFSKHQRLHDGHFCPVCGREFATASRLRDHVNVHTGNTPFSCTICDRRFAKRSSLTQHQRYHRDHKSFPCRFCQKSFNSKYACAVHERLHTGENPFKCLFPGCSKAFPQKIQLKLHINSHHRK